MRNQDETELPPPNTRRWTIRRKAALLRALVSGALTIEDASRRYALSLEELRAWNGISSAMACTAYARPEYRYIARAGAVLAGSARPMVDRPKVVS